MKVTDFDYDLPEQLIAQTPLDNRSSSRLLVLDKKTGEVNYYYSIVLSNGVKTFGCTCGENSDLVKIGLFIPAMMYIDVVEKNGVQKLKVVKVDLPEQNKEGAK
mgnify:CR=1 FL=1